MQFTLESTGNFEVWSPLTAPAPLIHDNGDGIETVTVKGPASFPAGSRRFLHLLVGLQLAP
ncbi:MAG: hypothetical protein ACKV19_21475 [Verrucomicrobiales bacterium]